MASETVAIRFDSLKKYVDEIGGMILQEGDSIEAYIPIAVEQVPGGVGFTIRGKLVGEEVVLEDCIVATGEGKSFHLKPIDLQPWAEYVNSRE